jgi:hypothetical protein
MIFPQKIVSVRQVANSPSPPAMVANNHNLYFTIGPEDGPQSSEDGSGLHSPVFDAQDQFPSSDFDIQHVLAAHLNYSSSLIQPQQPPLIDTVSLETPSVNFTSDYPIPPHQQLGIEYGPQSSTNPRSSPIAPGAEGEIFNLNYISLGRRSSRQPHDPSVARKRVPMDEDRLPTPISPSEPVPSVVAKRLQDRTAGSTAVIACRQCRGRKIRCDSARPVCTNCHRRKNLCEYDAAPKRRGPDKRPGTRRRSCKKRPADGSTSPARKQKKTAVENSSTEDGSPTEAKVKALHSNSSKREQDTLAIQQTAPTELHRSADGIATSKSNLPRRHSSIDYDQLSYKSPYNELHTSERMTHHKFLPAPSPALELAQREWWINNSSTYPIKEIAAHVKYLFSDTGHWLSFLNLDYFLETLYHSENHFTIRPSLIYSILAMATLMKSSQAEGGEQGRDRALVLRDSAQIFLEASWNSGWIDTMLAETALILTLFEMSVHPLYNPDRISVALAFLDNIIHHLGLTSLDSSDPDVNVYPQGGVPVVNTPGLDDPDRKCTCIPTDSAMRPDPVTSWSYPPPWDSSWTPLQIRDEECRRVCWCAIGLVASYNAQCAAFNYQCPPLFLSNCSNLALLFPGEVVDRASPTYRSADSQSPKESVWALYCRSMLLWNYSNHLYGQLDVNGESARECQESWNETQAIQDSLDMHTCNLDTALIYMTREYIYNTRLNITKIFHRFQGLLARSPILNRRQAQTWLYYQDQVIKRVKTSIEDITDPRGHQLTRRPFQATWFSNQLSICLMLFHHDRALVAALDLAKSIIVPIDVMNMLWPCPLQQRHCAILREQLIEACASVGMAPPLDSQYSIPPALQSLFL